MNSLLPQSVLLSGYSELRDIVQSQDWSTSPLGLPGTWPQVLVQGVRLIMASKVPMFLAWGPENILIYNAAYADILGCKHPAAFGRPMAEVWSEIWAEVSPFVQKAKSGEAVYYENFPLVLQRHGHSEQVWFTFSYSPLFCEDSTVNGVLCTCSETTDFMRAQQRQAFQLEMADRLRGLADPFEVTSKASFLLGEHLKVSRVLFAELSGPDDAAKWHSEYREGALSPYTAINNLSDFGPEVYAQLKCGKTRVFEDSLLEPRAQLPAVRASLLAVSARAGISVPIIRDGRLRTALLVQHKEPRHWTRGEITLVEDVAERIWNAVERARAEGELRRLNQLLEVRVADRTAERDRLWGMSQDLLAVASIEGYFISCNPAFTATLGWDTNNLQSIPFRDLVHADDHTELDRAMAELSAGRAVSGIVLRDLHKDGSYRWISWTAVPENELLFVVGRDVTAEKAQAEALQRSEDALRQSQKMEAIGQLTGGLAHDFNNLLAGMVGHIDILQIRTRQARFDELPRYLSTLRAITDRAAALTHRLLAFSRRQTLDPKPTNVNALVNAMAELINRTVGPSISTELQLAPDTWLTRCDANQLESALLNLAINARDAMPEGGHLVIKTSNTVLGEQSLAVIDEGAVPGEYVGIDVSDTGTGMTGEVAKRAFDPFFTTKPIGQGTGLGLSMVFGFVKQSGGHVRINSQVGKGTMVRLTLPRYMGDEKPEEPVEVPCPSTAVTAAPTRATVLIVDDEAPLRQLLAESLSERGFQVLEAADGAEGLRVLQSEVNIDLLISDVGLPGNMNGRQMADAARVFRPDLKVLFITGYADKAAIREGNLGIGMHVLTKPFTLDALARRMDQLLDSSVPDASGTKKI